MNQLGDGARPHHDERRSVEPGSRETNRQREQQTDPRSGGQKTTGQSKTGRGYNTFPADEDMSTDDNGVDEDSAVETGRGSPRQTSLRADKSANGQSRASGKTGKQKSGTSSKQKIGRSAGDKIVKSQGGRTGNARASARGRSGSTRTSTARRASAVKAGKR